MKRFVCAVLICLMLAGCAPAPTAQGTVFAMDTVMELQIWGEDSALAYDRLLATLAEQESLWSVKKEGSVLYQLNSGDPQYVPSPEHASLLNRVEALAERTGGAFDPKLGAVSGLWNFSASDPVVPDPEAVAAALEKAQWDLGGAVKGWTGQQCVQVLQALRIDRAILNLGGNIQTYGEKPDGKPWQIGIQNPDGGDSIGILSVEGTMAVVTSGDYQRYFEENGVKYHHILDPETGCPVQTELRSVTVICRDGLTADVLSTALFVMGVEKAARFWRDSDDFEAVFILTGGQILATEGTVLSGCEYGVIQREK